MNPIGQHITNAVNAGRVKNAAEVARLLKVSRPTVSRWMSGENAPSAEEARALADLIGAPEGLIMAECEATRAKDDATRSAWLRVARMCARQEKKLTQLTLALLAVVTLFVTPKENAFADQAITAQNGSSYTLWSFTKAITAKAKALLIAARNSLEDALAPRRWMGLQGIL